MKKINTVFISYRRSDTPGEARTLHNALIPILGEKNVFLDVEGIPPASDFREEIRKRVEAADLLVVLIGRNFLRPVESPGTEQEPNREDGRRVDNPVDFVRLEIELAIKRGIAIVPVLVQGASMPSAEQLPEAIRVLAYREAFEVRHNHWNRDVAELLRRLRLYRRIWRPVLAATPAAMVLMLAAAGWYFSRQDTPETPSNQTSPSSDEPRPHSGEPKTTEDDSTRKPGPSSGPEKKPVSKPEAPAQRQSGTPANRQTSSADSTPPPTLPRKDTPSGEQIPITPPVQTLEDLRKDASSRIARLQNPTDVPVMRSLLQDLYPGELVYSKMVFPQLITQLQMKAQSADESRLKEIVSRLPQR